MLEHGTGGLNVDGCRIGRPSRNQRRATAEATTHEPTGTAAKGTGLSRHRAAGGLRTWCCPTPRTVSRWDAAGEGDHGRFQAGKHGCVWQARHLRRGRRAVDKAGYANADGMETVTAWECHPDCPVRLLDEQTGELMR